MRRSAYFGVALIGLLVVAAISMAAGSGRKPPKEVQSAVSLRRITASEVTDIIRRFPGIVPSYIDPRKYDSEHLARLFRFSEVTAGTLSDVFPAARFYKGLDFNRPPIPYLMAVVGDKYCLPPEGFNRLLSYVGLEVNDKNILSLAKAFVVLAVGSRAVFDSPLMDLAQGKPGGDELLAFPDVTFGEGKGISELRSGATYDARLKVKVDGRDEEWWFDVKYGQFALVSRGDDKGLILQYMPKILYPIQTQGRLGSTPKIVVLSDPYIYAEAEPRGPDTILHCYATVEQNGSPTNMEVVFSLTGFPYNARNVYVRVTDTIWKDSISAGIRHYRRVFIDGQGNGADTWKPPVDSTGICVAGAGFADTLDTCPPYPTYRDTSTVELTPEKKRLTIITGSETLRTRFCQQSFLSQGPGQDSAYAKLVDKALLRSWQYQSVLWNLGAPPDANSVHDVVINDAKHWYHGSAKRDPYSSPGPDRVIHIPSYIPWDSLHYTNEDSLIRVAMAHEFYHGIQWGLSQDKWIDSTWDWFTEGQALFLPSVQDQGEEFLGSSSYYPAFANVYLTQKLNTSPTALSYSCDIFWRFMYENFGRDSGGVQLVKDCYAANVGTNNSIGRGKAAIDSAIRTYVPAGGTPRPGWSNFGQVLDQFAVACYLNDDTFFRCWNPNPPGVYSRPDFTLGTGTAFRLGPNETDTIGFKDSIPHSFGIDLMEVTLDSIVDTVLVSLTRPANETLTLSARLVKFSPINNNVRYRVAPPIESLPDSSTTWQQCSLPTATNERICLVLTRHDTLDDSGCDYRAKFWVKRAVEVSELLPATDTLMSGTPFTPRAVVVNRGWMKESLYVRYKIGTDSVYSDSQPVTLSPGHRDTITFREWTAETGSYNTCCWVYLKSDSTRSDDTLHGFLEVLPEMGLFWRLDFDGGAWNQDMAQPCADPGMQPGGGGRIRHQWICCWHQSPSSGDTWLFWISHDPDYACLSWQESTETTWDSMISPRINLADCHSCSLLQSTYFTLDWRGTKQVLVSADDGASWVPVWDYAWSGGQPPDTIDISQYADSSRNVRIAWVYDGLVQKRKAWCVDDVEIRGSPARSCDVAVNGIAYPCGAITYGTPIVPRAYVVNHGIQSESLWVHMNIDGDSALTYAWLAPHADTLIEFPSTWLAPDTYTMTCYVELPNDSDECRANDTATMSFSVVADTWMPKFPVYNGRGMRSGAAIVAVDSEKLFCAPGNGSPTNGYAFAKYLVVEDLWKARHTTIQKFLPGSALAYPGDGDSIYAIRGGGYRDFYGYSISQDRWETLRGTPDALGDGAGLACLNSDYVFALRGSGRSFYCYHVPQRAWYGRCDTPESIGAGGRLVSVGGYLYAFRGDRKRDFYKYVPEANSWVTLAPTPVPVKTGAAMACDPVTGLIYAFFGGDANDSDTSFYVYDGYQWLPKHPTPVATRSGGCLTYANHSFYGGVGIGGNHSFWRYSPPYYTCFLEAGGPQGWTGPAEASLPAQSYVSGDRLDRDERLTYDPSDKQTPQYSADGLWIAYTACDTASVVAGLYRIPAAGGPPDTLGSDGVTYEDPRWSHSHSWLVAAAGDGIYKVVSGIAPVRLAAGIAAGPCVTPNDSWVLYQAFDNTEHLHQVRRVRPDGTGDTCLTPGTDEYLEPQPISDSQFVCARLKNEAYQLAKLTGGRETWLTSDYAENTCINVSPTGEWLAYQKLDGSGFWQIYKMRVDGTEETRITDGTCNCETPVFSPDGSYIAYTRWPDGSEYSQVCYKDTNSAVAEVALNAPDAMRENPCWSPDCQYIIYELTTEFGTPALAPGHKKQLKQIGRARTHIKHPGDGVEGHSIIPRTFALYQNRPNPFGRATTIRYALPVPSLTELSIFDVAGRTVTRLVRCPQKPGYYSVRWNGTDSRGRTVAAGTYFYVLKSNKKLAQKRMLLVR